MAIILFVQNWGILSLESGLISAVLTTPLILLLPFCAYEADGKTSLKRAGFFTAAPVIAAFLASSIGAIATSLPELRIHFEQIGMNVLATILIFGIGASLSTAVFYRKNKYFGVLLALIQIVWVWTWSAAAAVAVRHTGWF